MHETWEKRRRAAAGDFTLYTGALGTALLLFRAYRVTGDCADLATCAGMVAACSAASKQEEFITFICGRAGVCALGAVVAKHAGDEAGVARYLSAFKEIKIPSNFPDELLYGRAGYLWACTFLNKHLERTRYHQPLQTASPVGTTLPLREMIIIVLCTGAMGLLKSDSWRQRQRQRRSSGKEGCSKELEYVMEYAGMPTHLSLYRLTKNKEYLYRAKAFACFILDRANQLIADGIMHSGDEQYSLFEGQAGMHGADVCMSKYAVISCARRVESIDTKDSVCRSNEPNVEVAMSWV